MSDDARALLGFAIDLVDCGLDILRNHITSDAQLKHQSALIPGGTLGKHFRHVAETYDAFLSTLKGDPYGGPPAIDYDAILPDTRKTTAGSLEACTTAMQRVRDGLVALGEVEDLDGKFELTVDVVAITPARQEMKSTLGREVGLSSATADSSCGFVHCTRCIITPWSASLPCTNL